MIIMDTSYKFWEEWEIKYLEENYGKLKYKDIAKYLGRKEKSIRDKVYNIRSKYKKSVTD